MLFSSGKPYIHIDMDKDYLVDILYSCILLSAALNFKVKKELRWQYLNLCLQNLSSLPISLSI